MPKKNFFYFSLQNSCQQEEYFIFVIFIKIQWHVNMLYRSKKYEIFKRTKFVFIRISKIFFRKDSIVYIYIYIYIYKSIHILKIQNNEGTDEGMCDL